MVLRPSKSVPKVRELNRFLAIWVSNGGGEGEGRTVSEPPLFSLNTVAASGLGREIWIVGNGCSVWCRECRFLSVGLLLSILLREKPQNESILSVVEMSSFWWLNAAEERASWNSSYCWVERDTHSVVGSWFDWDWSSDRKGEEGRDCWCSITLMRLDTKGRSSM